MKKLALGITLLALTALTARSGDGPLYRRFVGATTVMQGTGGTVVQVGGVDFWQDGTPPRHYRKLGQVDEEWRTAGMDRFDMKRLAPVVKKAGGDAAVMITSTSNGEAVYDVAVIKYQ